MLLKKSKFYRKINITQAFELKLEIIILNKNLLFQLLLSLCVTKIIVL
jgi:hypothetical protein